MNKKLTKNIVAKVRDTFRCFGGGKYMRDNPISIALATMPAQFAAGVDVEQVVNLVAHEIHLDQRRKAKKEKHLKAKRRNIYSP